VIENTKSRTVRITTVWAKPRCS